MCAAACVVCACISHKIFKDVTLLFLYIFHAVCVCTDLCTDIFDTVYMCVHICIHIYT